jgi:hypothetical protein
LLKVVTGAGRLPELGADVTGGLVVGADDDSAVYALMAALLAGIDRLSTSGDGRRIFSELADSFAQAERWLVPEPDERLPGIWRSTLEGLLDQVMSRSPDRPPSLQPGEGLVLGLAAAIELWHQEARRREEPLHLLLGIADERYGGAPRLVFDRPVAGLLMRPGSLVAAWALAPVLGGTRWFVGLFRSAAARIRAPEAAARNLVDALREERRRSQPPPLDLASLDADDFRLPADARGLLVCLHGLLATDLGTFDGLLAKIRNPDAAALARAGGGAAALLENEELSRAVGKAIDAALPVVGWAHDTLTSIDQNALDLARLIDRHLGGSALKVAFLCHSRGGLVARAAFLKLLRKDPDWIGRVCGAVTFGTPHRGAPFAEHPDRHLGVTLMTGWSRRQIAAVLDMAAYVESRGNMEGIADLRPPSAAGKPFIRELEEAELAASPAGKSSVLNVLAVGGVVESGARPEELKDRLVGLFRAYAESYGGIEEHDLVVPWSSAAAANADRDGPVRTTCDHFSFFAGHCAGDAHELVLRRVNEWFALDEVIRDAIRDYQQQQLRGQAEAEARLAHHLGLIRRDD